MSFGNAKQYAVAETTKTSECRRDVKEIRSYSAAALLGRVADRASSLGVIRLIPIAV